MEFHIFIFSLAVVRFARKNKASGPYRVIAVERHQPGVCSDIVWDAMVAAAFVVVSVAVFFTKAPRSNRNSGNKLKAQKAMQFGFKRRTYDTGR